jgi:hypothetical protein
MLMKNRHLSPALAQRLPGRRTLTAALAALALGLAGCEKNDPDRAPASATEEAGLQQLLGMGFKREHIQDKGTYWLLEDDITIQKDNLPAVGAGPAVRPGTVVGQQHQSSTHALIAYAKQPLITVRIDDSFPSQWRGEAEQAVRDWNGIEGARVDLTLVSSGQADITIKGQDLGLATYGLGEYPTNGNPGSQVIINRLNAPDYRRRTTIVHEIGHCLGLRHTDLDSYETERGNHIAGTPRKDRNSVMNSGSASIHYQPWRGFSAFDEIAFQNLYPGFSSVLYPNQTLYQRQFIRSANGLFSLTLQTDGNLVLYKHGLDGAQVLWQTHTGDKPHITRCVMQADGNLVLYDANSTPYWQTGTGTFPGSQLVIQNDGNAVIYQQGRVVVATGTQG